MWGVLLAFVVDRVVKQLAARVTAGRLFFYIENSVGPFGLPLGKQVLLGVGAVAVVFLVYWASVAWRQERNLQLWATLLMLAGGMSNLLDRVTRGGVVDVFHVPGLFSFNLADVYLSLGVGLLLFLGAAHKS